MTALLRTSLHGLGEPRSGKVRDVYDLGEAVLIVATDRISAFDVIMANGIPQKGAILNQMSAFWFDKLADICPHHVITADDDELRRQIAEFGPELEGRTTLARKAEPLPIECVARGYISGSLLKEYKAQGTTTHGLNLPPGLIDGSQLPEPIFTPATKAAQGHDENLSAKEAANLVGREIATTIAEWTIRLYTAAAEHAGRAGLILADTKFEFGKTDDGLIWIDEALTPDSSRYWEASKYDPGRSQPSFDKQFVRDYLESIAWDKRPPGPRLPNDVVEKTRQKYVEAFHRVVGRPFAN